MKKKRTWIISGIVAVLIAGGIYLATRSTTSQTGSIDSLLANATVGASDAHDADDRVDSTGSIIPEAAVDALIQYVEQLVEQLVK